MSLRNVLDKQKAHWFRLLVMDWDDFEESEKQAFYFYSLGRTFIILVFTWAFLATVFDAITDLAQGPPTEQEIWLEGLSKCKNLDSNGDPSGSCYKALGPRPHTTYDPETLANLARRGVIFSDHIQDGHLLVPRNGPVQIPPETQQPNTVRVKVEATPELQKILKDTRTTAIATSPKTKDTVEYTVMVGEDSHVGDAIWDNFHKLARQARAEAQEKEAKEAQAAAALEIARSTPFYGAYLVPYDTGIVGEMKNTAGPLEN